MPWQGCHNMTAAGGSHFQDQSFHWHLSGLHFGDYTVLLDNGLTQLQASDAETHIAFYAGWPNAFSALPVVKEVFEKRQKQPSRLDRRREPYTNIERPKSAQTVLPCPK
jgi:hypothetical protein